LSGATSGGGMAVRLSDLPVLDVLAAVFLRLALLLAIVVDEGVRQNPVQPRLEVRARLVLVESGIGLRIGLLDKVLGVGGIASHPQRSRIELVDVFYSVALETLRPLGGRLGDFLD